MENLEATSARIIPTEIPRIQPEVILISEKETVLKNPSSSQIVPKRQMTFNGETSSKSMPIATEAICHSNKAKIMLSIFFTATPFFLFMAPIKIF